MKNHESIFKFSVLCQHCRTGSILRAFVPCGRMKLDGSEKLSCECLNISNGLRFVASKLPAKTSRVVLGAGTFNTGRICLYVASAIKSEPFILKWLVGIP